MDIVRILSVSHLVVFGLLFIKAYPSHKAAQATFLFLFCLISYIIIGLNFTELSGWKWIFYFPTMGLPISFWIISKAYFDDNFEFKKWILAIVLLIIAIKGFLFYFKSNYEIIQPFESMILIFPHLLTIGFIILGIIEAARNYSTDLVVSRHRFRVIFIIATSFLMIVTVVTEISFNNDVPITLDLLQKISILILAYYFTFDLLQFQSEFFESPQKIEKETTEIRETDPQLIRQLMDLMDTQNIYLTEGLTIRMLSEKMNIKEYKLRQAINQHLGFRNFNEFLNSYRIDEAKEILSKKENRQMTILEIAYQLGYASLAPFNKAFKKETGVTPTEFRRGNY